MQKQVRQKLISEICWLLGVGALAVLLEYGIIVLLDLHPILSVKVQAFIGLLTVAYLVRMVARVWKSRGSTDGFEINGNKK